MTSKKIQTAIKNHTHLERFSSFVIDSPWIFYNSIKEASTFNRHKDPSPKTHPNTSHTSYSETDSYKMLCDLPPLERYTDQGFGD